MGDVIRWRCAACGSLEDSVCLPAAWRLRYVRTRTGWAERTLCPRFKCGELFGGLTAPPVTAPAGVEEK